MCILTQVPWYLCELCKGLGHKLCKTLALEQSDFALKAWDFKVYRFVPCTL